MNTQHTTRGPVRGEVFQLSVWVAAILLFACGDTLTSLLMFGQGGQEGNILLASALKVMGPSIWSFMVLKFLATAAAVVVARLRPGVEGVVSLIMLFVGLFLVVQNVTVLISM